MSDKKPAQREMAWAAATRAQKAAGVVFDRLQQTIEEALDVKNQAMRLVPDQAETLEAEWGRLQNQVQAAIYQHSHIPLVPHHTHPDFSPSSFKDLRADYGDVRWQALRLERELNQFAVRCEMVSFSSAGLRAWLSQLQDKYAQLARLSMNMVLDGMTIPPLADVDELSMLLQEAEMLMQADNSDRAVDKLEDARQIAEDIEERLVAELGLGDNERIDPVIATRQTTWAERDIVAARQRLDELASVHGTQVVQEAVRSIGKADKRLAEARELIAEAVSQSEDSEAGGDNTQLSLLTAMQLYYEIDLLCLVVDRLQRELAQQPGNNPK